MRSALGAKLGWLVLVLVLLLVPLSLVRNAIAERQERAAEVRAEIASYAGRSQHVVGPLLVLPYRLITRTYRVAKEGGTPEWLTEELTARIVLQPDQLVTDFDVTTESLKRGIYSVPLFRAATRLSGRFIVPDRAAYERTGSETVRYEYQWATPQLVFAVSDRRGLARLGGEALGAALGFSPESALGALPHGVRAPVAVPLDATTVPFRMELGLTGTERLDVVPVGRRNTIRLQGTWPHPSLEGTFAPVERQVGAGGFRALWQIDDWATGITADVVRSCGETAADGSGCALIAPDGPRAGVRFVDPVDQYLLSERTAKYGELFVLLVFAAFFLVEVLQRLRLHPAQYLLVGLALALFFLLTLALSEHLGFARAYWLAASGSIVLLGTYAAAILKGRARGALFAGGVAVIFGVLFVILNAEDTALLLGSLLLFAALGTVMLMTRKLDWYALPGMSPAGIRREVPGPGGPGGVVGDAGGPDRE